MRAPSAGRYRGIRILLAGILIALGAPAQAQTRDCSRTEMPGLIPLTELGSGDYLGAEGGLYPGGSNILPEAHRALGVRLANGVEPRDPAGMPSPDGKIGLISIGVSNTMITFSSFIDMVERSELVSSNVVPVNGAVSGQPIDSWLDPVGVPWTSRVPQMLDRAGLTPAQIQVAWVMLPDRQNGPKPFPEFTLAYADKLATMVQDLKTRFPSLNLAFMSSQEYHGYAVGYWGEEPVPYENGFGVKWLIERQILGDPSLNADQSAGEVRAPWLAWGPYTWANGENERDDGLTWECLDYRDDGVHPVGPGADKVAKLLFDHLATEPIAANWFLADAASVVTSTTSARPPSTTSAAGSETPQVPMSATERLIWSLIVGTVAGSVAGGATLWTLGRRRAGRAETR